MSTPRFFLALAGWSVAVLVALSARIAFISPGVSASEYAAWLLVGGTPVAITLILLRGRSARPIAHVLYDAERAGDTGREKGVVTRG